MKPSTLIYGISILIPGIRATVSWAATGFNIHTGQEFSVTTVPVTNVTALFHNLNKMDLGLESRDASVSYSGNWCGAAQNPPDDTKAITNVYGRWDVVDVSLRSDQSDTDNAMLCQWVGIDGTGQCDGLIQVGQFTQINPDGSTKVSAFWEYVPALPAMFVDLPINVGDELAGNVTMTSTHGGIMELINLTTGLGFSVTVSGEKGTLCGHSAEWILEDPTVGSGEATFPNFDNAVYSDCSATTSDGTVLGLGGATDIYLAQGSVVCDAQQRRGGDLLVRNSDS